jgi:YbaB/EbfC DNA-binding family
MTEQELTGWAAGVAAKAERYQHMRQQVAAVTATASSPDGAVTVTVSATGAVVNIVPTDKDGIRIQGFKQTLYVEDADGVQWTVFYNPRTGKYALAHGSGKT